MPGGHPKGAGLPPIDVDLVLGHVLHAQRPHSRQPGVLHRHAEELIAGRHELGVPEPAAILKHEIESGRRGQLRNRGRRKHVDPRFPDRHEPRRGARRDRFHLEIRALALLPVPQLDEDHGLVLAATAKAHTGDRHGGGHGLALRFPEVGLHLLDHRLGLLEGRAGRVWAETSIMPWSSSGR